MLTLGTIRDFFLFRSQAILAVARQPASLYLGPLLVLGAGFAREYDQEYLLAEPWYLLLPMAASLLGIVLLTTVLAIVYWRERSNTGSWWVTLRSIASVYWMTAPLAWLYAFPVEYWWEPVTAVKFNLYMLLFVSLYRVALMSRSVQVLYREKAWAATFVVLLFSDTVMLTALRFIPRPIYLVMGGIQLTPSEGLILSVHMMVTGICVLALPFLIIGVLVITFSRRDWIRFSVEAEERGSDVVIDRRGSSASTKLFVALPLVLGIVLAAWMLPTQALKWRLETGLKHGDYAAVAKLSRAHSESEFPPHLDPPPRPGYGDSPGKLYQDVLGLLDHQSSEWLLAIFRRKLMQEVEGRARSYGEYGYEGVDNAALKLQVKLLNRMDHPAELIEPQLYSLREMYGRTEDPERQQWIGQMIEAGGFTIQQPDTAEKSSEEAEE